MKKLSVVVFLMLGTISYKAQGVFLMKGQEIHQSSKIYGFELPFGKKWRRMKQEKRDASALAYNQTVYAGQVKPWRDTPAKFRVVEVEKGKDIEKYTLKAFDSGFEYQTTNYLTEDTMYLVRNENPLPVKGADGGEIGMTIQGIQRVPNNLKVGDRLPQYYDLTLMYPTSWTGQMTEKVYAGRQTTTKNDFGIHTDSRTGVRSLGNFKITSSYSVYNDIKHQVNITETVMNHTIHYVDAIVVDSVMLTFGGKDYMAFIIESETWTKRESIKDFSAERQDLADKMSANSKKSKEKFEAKRDKKAAKLGWTNDKGYMVQVYQEWFIPNYGVVKFITYALSGAVSVMSTSELISK